MKNTRKQNEVKQRTLPTLFLLLLCFVSQTKGAHISRISTDPEFQKNDLTGSIAGGTRLYIQGFDFDESDFDNQVFVGHYSCQIDNYYTSSSLLVCDLPPMFYGPHQNLRIAVIV